MTFFHRANYLQLPALTNHHPSVGNDADAKRTGRCCVAIRFLLSNLFWSGYKERFIQTIKHFVATQNFHNQFVALYTLYLSSQYLPLTRHSIDWCREIKCYVPSKHQYCQFEKIRICKHWHLKGVFVYNVNSSKCCNHRAADRLHWQQGHHNHIWYLHDAFSPRHVSRSVLYRPALLYCQHSDAISCRPASALCICMQRRVPGCQYARCSILSCCCCFWSAQVGRKSLQDMMVKLISLKLTLKFLGSSNILQTRQEQIKHNSGASILAAELLWWWRGEVSRVTSGPCLHVSMYPLVLQKGASEGS